MKSFFYTLYLGLLLIAINNARKLPFTLNVAKLRRKVAALIVSSSTFLSPTSVFAADPASFESQLKLIQAQQIDSQQAGFEVYLNFLCFAVPVLEYPSVVFNKYKS